MKILKDIEEIQKAVDEWLTHPHDEDMLTRKTHEGRKQIAFYIMCREFVFEYMTEVTYNSEENFDEEKMKVFFDDLCLAYRCIRGHESFDENRESFIYTKERPYRLADNPTANV